MFFQTIGFLISQYWLYFSLALIIGVLTGWFSVSVEQNKE
jgi:uncharacterized membrane-anchored protein YhcB (DUF1043 family)